MIAALKISTLDVEEAHRYLSSYQTTRRHIQEDISKYFEYLRSRPVYLDIRLNKKPIAYLRISL
jgi:hypothetical protein